MGVLSTLVVDSIWIAVIVLLITFVPGIPPHMEFTFYSNTPPLPFKGGLELNGKLNNAKKLFVDEIKGPEHMEVHNGALYTTLEGGYVAKIVGDDIIPIVKFGKKCDGLHESEVCGRPLGLTFDTKGFMYVADAYYGIFKVNTSTGEYEQLVSMNTKIEGRLPKLPNAVAVGKDGCLYWSDSSTSHSLHDVVYTLLGDGTGRLIKYDPGTGSNNVLIDNLHFANGVTLSEDESFVLVADLFRSRILKFNIKGPREGETEVFIDGLPGYPDNMHWDGKKEFYVTLAVPVDNENPGLSALLGPHPFFRKFIARLLYIIEFPALLLNECYPNYYSKIFGHWVGNFAMISGTSTNRTTVVFFNEDGEITRSLHSTNGEIGMITDLAMLNDKYYLGSYSNPYLATVEVDVVTN